MTPAELVSRLEGPGAPLILDVRSPEEYADGHIPGAINVPYDQIEARLGSLEEHRETEVVVYCRTGRRAGVAESALSEAGFKRIRDLEGHMVGWREAELPLVVPAACC
jgi:rhodanese-related sulfurtransferase